MGGEEKKKKDRKRDEQAVLFKQSYKVIKCLGGANQTTVCMWNTPEFSKCEKYAYTYTRLACC